MIVPAIVQSDGPLLVLGAPRYLPMPIPRSQAQSPESILVRLLDQLTDSQLTVLASPTGLRAAELTSPEQRALFAALVPEGKALRVTPTYQAVLDDTKGGAWVLETRKTSPALPPVEPIPNTPIARVPNQLKPGQLLFTAPRWDAKIALEGVTTVAELLARCQEATGQELRADALFSAISVQAKSAPGLRVRVGDVLKALCWGLQATFRQVGPISLLTDDQEGLAVLSLRAHQAAWQSELAAYRESKAAQGRLAARPLSSLLGASPTLAGRYPINQVPTLFQAPVKSWLENQRRLQEELKARQDQAAAFGGRFPPPPPPRGGREPAGYPSVLVVTAVLEAEAVTPGKGVAGLLTTMPLPLVPVPEQPASPIVLEGRLGQGTRVLAAPKSPEEARAVVQAAAQQGIGIVWIDVDQDLAPLDAALRAGKERHIAIGAALSLLRPNDPAVPLSAHDQSLLGETSPWLIPSAPEARASLQRRLAALKKRKGLSGVLCLDTAPPGYAQRDFELDHDGTGLGYTLPQRLAFLRKHGRDPLDLAALDRVLPKEVPYWNRERKEVRAAFLRDAFALLQANLGTDRPVFFWGDSENWLGSWESADRLPEQVMPPYIVGSLDQRAPFVHTVSQQALRMIAYQPQEPLLTTLRGAITGDLTPWDGLVLDLRQVPSGKIGDILADISVKRSAPPP